MKLIFLNTFWADAVNTACYVLNRVLIRPILKKTPYELFKGRKLYNKRTMLIEETVDISYDESNEKVQDKSKKLQMMVK